MGKGSIILKSDPQIEGSVINQLIQHYEDKNLIINDTDVGIQGDQGIPGVQGLKGDKGDKGDQGDQGIQGIQGIQGVKGDKGDKGDTGDQGIIGLTGPKGDTGSNGVTPTKNVDYFDGVNIEYQYAVNGSFTVAPAIVVNQLNPIGWTTTPPTIDVLEYLWITKAKKSHDGLTLLENWSAPIRFSGVAGIGPTGTVGQSSRTVVMSITDQTFIYDLTGSTPDPATATITATAANTQGTPYYDFKVDGVSKQNGILNAYVYTPQASYSNMPEMLQVDLREDSTITDVLASDLTTALGIKEGTDFITVDISNQSATLQTTIVGTVDYSGSGVTIEVYVGATLINIDQTGPYGINTYRVSAVGTNITPGTRTGADGTTTTTYGVHKDMIADNAHIIYTVVVTNAAGVEMTFTRKQTFSKAWAGNDGLDGADGTNGTNGTNGTDGAAGIHARGVVLTTTAQGFSYNTSGTTPSPASATITATPVNTTGTVYYEFFKNDVSQGAASTTATYTYTPQASYLSMPDKIEVQIREGGGGNPILARDQMTMVGLRAGANAFTITLSNEAHTLPTTTGAVVTYTGSGTSIYAWEGNTQLTVDQNAAYGNSTFRVTSASGSNITTGSASGADGTTARIYGDHSAMIADTATVTYTIVVKSSEGIETTFTKIQSFAKSWQGAVGNVGNPGPLGPSPVYRGEYSAGTAYYGNTNRVDIVKYSGSYYVVRSDLNGTTTGNLPTNTTYWNSFGTTFSAVATEVLFASIAYIDNLGIRLGTLGGWIVDADSMYTGTKVTGNGYSAAATHMTIKSDGSIHAYKFYINADGTTNFNGVTLSHMVRKKASATVLQNIHTGITSAYNTGGYILRKTITFPNGIYGALRVKLDLRAEDAGSGGIAEASIRYNSGTFFTPDTAWTATIAAYFTTVDSSGPGDPIRVWLPGETIELWLKATGDMTVYAENFALYYVDDPDAFVAVAYV
jgi:hypothetical protein